ncbi:MAG: hypothetical protein ACREOH_08970 [Candidatus Entotheonellia bacterium]
MRKITTSSRKGAYHCQPTNRPILGAEITAYIENGGTIEKAQAIAAHESPRTMQLYDRIGDEITLDEVERSAV